MREDDNRGGATDATSGGQSLIAGELFIKWIIALINLRAVDEAASRRRRQARKLCHLLRIRQRRNGTGGESRSGRLKAWIGYREEMCRRPRPFRPPNRARRNHMRHLTKGQDESWNSHK